MKIVLKKYWLSKLVATVYAETNKTFLAKTNYKNTGKQKKSNMNLFANIILINVVVVILVIIGPRVWWVRQTIGNPKKALLTKKGFFFT